MTHLIHRRGTLHAGLAWGLAMALPSARACEFVTSNLTVVHPWVRATAPGATSASVCMGFKDVVISDRLIDARTPVAERIDMGGTGDETGIDFQIDAGEESALTEAGQHLKLVGLAFPLGLGTSYPLRLLFQKAGPIDALLTVDYARFR